MSVLVDANVWSLALRRLPAALAAEDQRLVRALERLIARSEASIIGPIRQEVLSGIRSPAMFTAVLERLRAFPDEALLTEDFERAADYHNQCLARGIAGSHYDFLLCAVSGRLDAPVFTLDRDFQRYAPVLSLRLHSA